MSVNNIGLKSYEDLFKDDKGRKTEEIVPMDIRELRPYAEQPFKVLLFNKLYAVFLPIFNTSHSSSTVSMSLYLLSIVITCGKIYFCYFITMMSQKF